MTPEILAEIENQCQKIMQKLGCEDYDTCIEKLKKIQGGNHETNKTQNYS